MASSRGCEHNWWDLPWGHGRIKDKGVVRLWFFCRYCLKVETREIPEEMWDWPEDELV